MLGGVKIDGSTVTLNGNNQLVAAQYSLPTASTTVLGGVRVDGSTITISGGVISSNLKSRNSITSTTASLANNAAGNITITGWKSYMLLSIQTSAAAWVTVYTSSAARTADASRTITSDPTPGSGVIAEVITTSANTQIFSPAVLGFSDEVSPSTDIQVKVVNRSGSTAAITITMKLIQLEV